MKIAFITDQFPALGETFILDQITSLIDLGHELYIIASISPCENKTHDKVNQYNLNRSAFYTNPPKNLMQRLSGALKIIQKNFQYNRSYLLKLLNIAKYGKRALGLSLLFRVEPFIVNQYDIIHCHFGPNGVTYLFLKDLFKVPMIVTFHGYDYSKIQYAKGRDYYKEMFSRVERITAPSNYAVNKVLNLGCPSDKIIKIPSGIDLSLFTFKERHFIKNEPIKIFTVARLVEKKGLPYALYAISEIAKRYSIQYEIVGRGHPAYQEKLRNLVKKLNLEGIVRFSEPRTAKELALIYQRSHIFLMASHTAKNGDEESQGMVLAEAQASGLPIVTTRHNGFPESMLEGESGFLAEEKNVPSLAEQLERMIQVSDRWPEMGRKGRKFVENNFDILKIARQLESLYKNIISHSKKIKK